MNFNKQDRLQVKTRAFFVVPNIPLFRDRLLDHLLWLVHERRPELKGNYTLGQLSQELSVPSTIETKQIDLDLGNGEFVSFELDSTMFLISVQRVTETSRRTGHVIGKDVKELGWLLSDFAMHGDPQVVLHEVRLAGDPRHPGEQLQRLGLLDSTRDIAYDGIGWLVWKELHTIRVACLRPDYEAQVLIELLLRALLLSTHEKVAEDLRNQVLDLQRRADVLLESERTARLVSNAQELVTFVLEMRGELATLRGQIEAIAEAGRRQAEKGSQAVQYAYNLLQHSFGSAEYVLEETSNSLDVLDALVDGLANTAITRQSLHYSELEHRSNVFFTIAEIIFALGLAIETGRVFITLFERSGRTLVWQEQAEVHVFSAVFFLGVLSLIWFVLRRVPARG